MLRQPGDVLKRVGHPYALTPAKAARPASELPDGPMRILPEFSALSGTWSGPFIMAPYNEQVVRRTADLLGYGAPPPRNCMSSALHLQQGRSVYIAGCGWRARVQASRSSTRSASLPRASSWRRSSLLAPPSPPPSSSSPPRSTSCASSSRPRARGRRARRWRRASSPLSSSARACRTPAARPSKPSPSSKCARRASALCRRWACATPREQRS